MRTIAPRPVGADENTAPVLNGFADPHLNRDAAVNGDILVQPVLPSEAGATTAAMDMLQLAQRAANATTREARTCAIRDHRWSNFNRPLIWAAARPDATHPIVEWMARAAAGSQVSIRGFNAEAVDGPVAVHDAWLALRAGLRAMGIESRAGLAEWHSREGFGDVAVSAHLHAHVQVRILHDTFEILGGRNTDAPLRSCMMRSPTI